MTEPSRISQPMPVAESARTRHDPRGALGQVIPRRASVSWWLGLLLALGFALIVTPTITAERWLLRFQPGTVTEGHAAAFTVRAAMIASPDTLRLGGGVVVARGDIATHDEAALADAVAEAMPSGPVFYAALFAVCFALAAIFGHHLRRSVKGRLVRVQVASLVAIAALAIAVKIVLLSTALSALVVPVALLAMVPTMALDRTVGLATGVLAALVVSLAAPFDVGLAIVLLAQAATAGVVIAEHPKRPWRSAVIAGAAAVLCTSAGYLVLAYLSGRTPSIADPLHAGWFAAALGPALATAIAAPLLPAYQLVVGEITQARLFALEDLGHPLLRQIAEKSPGTWQHSLMMANMAEIAANAIGANGRLVRVGAYFHDLGKSLQAKYFIENLEPGEASPHDQLPPDVSCDAILAHVTEGIVAARRAGLHERIVDFMHMHHGNGVLEYFWVKCREQGNPHNFTVEDFRYPGHPPQSRETAILAICDAVEAASRTLRKPDAQAIDALVQRIVYGKLHLGQLDESGLSMGDLRRISDSLRETIRHANHGRIEYPWQKAEQDASASAVATTGPRLDSGDLARRTPRPGDSGARGPLPQATDSDAAFAITADIRTAAAAVPVAADADDDAGTAKIRAGTAHNAGRHDGVPQERATESSARAAAPLTTAESRRAARDTERRTSASGRAARATQPGPVPRVTGSQAIPITGRITAPVPAQDRVTSERAAVASPVADDAATLIDSRTMYRTEHGDLASSVRRGSTGHPPVPSDSAQLPATLATLVTRTPTAPFHAQPDPDEPGRTPGAEPAGAIAPLPATHSAEGSGTTQPMIAAAPRTVITPAPAPATSPAPVTPLMARATSPMTAQPTPSRGTVLVPPDFDGAILEPSRTPPIVPASPRATSTSESAARSPGLASSGLRTVDLDDAITQPSLATASLDSAVTSPTLATLAHVRAGQPSADAAVTNPTLATLANARPAAHSLDAAVTNPTMATLASSRTALQSPEGGVTTPTLATLASARAASESLDGAVTSLVVPPGVIAPPGPALDDAVTRLALSSSASKPKPIAKPLRTSGLANPRVPDTKRGQGESREPARRAPSNAPANAPIATGTGPLPVDGRGASLDPPRVITPRTRTAQRDAVPASVTEPALAQVSDSPWGSGLAARVDAALDDEWSSETPSYAPGDAELRALLGKPDPTRQQPPEEIERLRLQRAELESVPRRSPHPTAEVDPDDIEAAIEVAPPARRPNLANTIAANRRKKTE